MNSKLRRYDGIFIVLICYLVLVQISAIWPFTIDDAYIPLRYAKNWVAGNGILWLWIPKMTVEQYHYFIRNPLQGQQIRLELAQWLNQHAQAPNQVVLAHSPAATRYLDFCKHMAQEKPQVLVLTSAVEQGRIEYTPSDICLRQLLAEDKSYQLQELLETKDTYSRYRYEIYPKHHFCVQ